MSTSNLPPNSKPILDKWRGFAAGWLLILVGCTLAHLVQTSGGIQIKDVRFTGTAGKTLSGLLYIPANATPSTPAPGILAVHGYINSREAQSGFAIEYARRGYLVLALDQTGHGYSDGPAFSDGFGGPAALTYLRSLDLVDPNNIGLEGHSMGGWAVLAAAAAYPDDYQAIVLEGSSTGPPFAADGTPQWPRNLAVVFSAYDEFAELMWGTSRALDVADSTKLQTLFGTDAPVAANKTYGSIEQGDARRLTQPPVTHPGDHLSRAAIADSLEWFALTLKGGKPVKSNNQIWMYKELGTFIALIGFVVLLLGTFHLLLQTHYFERLKAWPQNPAQTTRTARWWGVATLLAVVPVATFFPLFGWAEKLVLPSVWLPQAVTNQVVIWALTNAAIGWALLKLLKGNSNLDRSAWLPSMLLALATVGVGYVAVLLADFLFLLDFRFWFVGVKALSLAQLQTALVYIPFFGLYFVLSLGGLYSVLSIQGVSTRRLYLTNLMILAGGFLVFLLLEYGFLFATGSLLTPSEPLNTIIMIQFVPLLSVVALISTFTYLRTASHIPGALICALLVTWYIVAGQATQA